MGLKFWVLLISQNIDYSLSIPETSEKSNIS